MPGCGAVACAHWHRGGPPASGPLRLRRPPRPARRRPFRNGLGGSWGGSRTAARLSERLPGDRALAPAESRRGAAEARKVVSVRVPSAGFQHSSIRGARMIEELGKKPARPRRRRGTSTTSRRKRNSTTRSSCPTHGHVLDDPNDQLLPTRVARLPGLLWAQGVAASTRRCSRITVAATRRRRRRPPGVPRRTAREPRRSRGGAAAAQPLSAGAARRCRVRFRSA